MVPATKDERDNQDSNDNNDFKDDKRSDYCWSPSLVSWLSFESFSNPEHAMSAGFIPKHGGYKKLLSYQKAEIVYDATVRFCDRFIDKLESYP